MDDTVTINTEESKRRSVDQLPSFISQNYNTGVPSFCRCFARCKHTKYLLPKQ